MIEFSEIPLVDPEQDGHALAIGRLCLSWASLDGTVTSLFGTVLGLDLTMTQIVADETNEIGKRCQIIEKALLTIRPPDDWKNNVISGLKKITKELGPARNRLVHDPWVNSSDVGVQKLDVRTKIGKPQSFQEATLQTHKFETVSTETIDNLNREIRDLCNALGCLSMSYSIWKEGGEMREIHDMWRRACTPRAPKRKER